jgi:hypothetical protein
MPTPLFRTIKTFLRTATQQTDFTWRYLAHADAAGRHLLTTERLEGVVIQVAHELKRQGVAAIPADQLLAGNPCLGDLIGAVDQLELTMATQVESARMDLDPLGAQPQKPFVVPLLAPNQILDPGRIFARFALQAPILQVVNTYFGMIVELTHTNVWHTLVSRQPPTRSQLWHRDPEDRHVLKVFLYLSDVDEGSGPLTYALGSHKRPYQIAPHSYRDGETARSTDEELAQMIPRHRWLTLTVPRGTMVFADTRGYHKGGLARSRERIAYIAEYLPRTGVGISTGHAWAPHTARSAAMS